MMDEQQLKEQIGWQDDAVDTGAYTVGVEDSLLDRDDEVRPDPTRREQLLHRRLFPRVTLVLTVFSLVGVFFWQLIAGNFTSVSESEPTANPLASEEDSTAVEAEPSKDEQIAELKRKLAFANQEQVLKEAEPSTEEPSPEPEPAETQVEPPPSPQPVVRSTPPPLEPPASPEPLLPPSPPSPQPSVEENLPDPHQLWQQASQIGSYGDVQAPTPASLQATAPRTVPPNSQPEWTTGVSGGTGTPPSTQNPPVTTTTPNIIASSRPSVSHGKSLMMIGTQASGELETAIAWAGKQTALNRKFLVRLTSPLQSNGTVVIPDGTRLVGEISQVSNSGLLQMSVVSVIENDRERALPSGAILVLGKGGRPLRAQVETPDGGGSNLAALALAGIAKAAEVANDSDEAFTFDSEAGSFSSTSSTDTDYLSGAIQGASEEVLAQMERRNRQALEQARGQETLFILEPGTPVQLFVNESISISATR
jgi:hypothetical protein